MCVNVSVCRVYYLECRRAPLFASHDAYSITLPAADPRPQAPHRSELVSERHGRHQRDQVSEPRLAYCRTYAALRLDEPVAVELVAPAGVALLREGAVWYQRKQ